jgi:UDP-N-acetylmuramoyl-L-alanyl-D-glutamate--2,6-diaminopimelate ligase
MTVAVTTLVNALQEAGLLVETTAPLPERVAQIVDDSRRVTAGSLFLAVRGAREDGHRYLDAAALGGATMAMVAEGEEAPMPAVRVRDTRRAAATLAAAFYGFPARSLRIVAVTGTNGKTTTVGMLRHLLDEPGAPAASVGTLGVLLGSVGTPLSDGGDRLTTPGPIELQRVLHDLVRRGVRLVALEASSHALHQRRLEGVPVDVGVFTNLTRDHLDYHGTMEAYRDAKALLIGLLGATGTAVVNADDAAWTALPAAPHTLRFSAGAADRADVRAATVHFSATSTAFTIETSAGRAHVVLPLLGDFNVANATGAAAAALALGLPLETVAERLSTLPQVPGRLEVLHRGPVILRDYAHTPDALERCLMAVRSLAVERGGRLLVLFGCGGDRDRGKRPVMGRIAETMADLVVLTSDNPRTEDPDRILDDIAAGMHGAPDSYARIEDRRDAIAFALERATDADVVVLAGKGHETYQVRGTVSYPFDEAAIVRELLAAQPGAPFE